MLFAQIEHPQNRGSRLAQAACYNDSAVRITLSGASRLNQMENECAP